MKYVLRNPKLTHSINDVIPGLLQGREIEHIPEYMFPNIKCENDPTLLDNIDDAVACLYTHLQNHSKILLVVDADTDGYCSSAMIWNYIKDIDSNANLCFICHDGKRHGLADTLEEVLEITPNLVILPDASSVDYDQHKILHDNGIDVLVIDHHDAQSYSKHAIVVNNQLSKRYPNKALCGAGVVYKFLQRYDLLKGYNFATKYLDLCALGLIADCISPRNPETRYYITEGLKNPHNKGFQELLNTQAFSIYKNGEELNYNKIAFYIAPLINAIVRVGSTEERTELFLNFIDPDKMVKSQKRGEEGQLVPVCKEVARKAVNARARQNRIKERALETLTMRIFKEDLLENKILILEVYESDNIPQELTGLLAGTFVEFYNRPCMIVRRSEAGMLRGSLRNNENFKEVPDFKSFLKDSGLMEYVEGHANAAGVSFPARSLNTLLDYSNNKISEEGLQNVYLVDYVFGEDELCIGDIALIIAEHDGLWGNDVKEPTAIVENITITSSSLLIMGEKKDSSKFTHNGVEYIRFKDKDFISKICEQPYAKITLYGTFGKNEWRGRTTPQFIIHDYEISPMKVAF